MCRLFGMTAGTQAVAATFWLLHAPDSLEAQSHRNADGSGIGFFDPAGQPVLDKQPEPGLRRRKVRQGDQAQFHPAGTRIRGDTSRVGPRCAVAPSQIQLRAFLFLSR